ncbi:MAG: DUF4845 domain-containing protein [Gammaproteobacteria bacterium]|nr:MAG: DUF4845 domain-containing protein [Gammaproteobacteria bacterium]
MSSKKQRGMSVLGILVLLAVVGFFLTVALKVGPLYLDNSFVKASLESLADENVHEMTDGAIRGQVWKFLDVNNVRDLDRDALKIVREKTRTLVTINYEKRVNFMGNVDVVVRFDNSYDSSK